MHGLAGMNKRGRPSMVAKLDADKMANNNPWRLPGRSLTFHLAEVHELRMLPAERIRNAPL